MPAAADLLREGGAPPPPVTPPTRGARALARARRIARALTARTPLRLGVFAVLALVATWPLLATAPAINEFRDAHVLAHYEQVARTSLLRFHELPLWDPYYCGGLYLLGTPQARFVSPTFLLTLLFGEGRGEALAAFAMILVGLEGAFRYARARRASSFAAALAAPLFALSGVFALSPSLGWINFFGFELLPWIALGTRMAVRGDRLGVVLAAGSLGWCVGFGGTYAAPLAAFWCAFEVLEALGAKRGRERIVVAALAAATAVLALGVAAVRLWPVYETLHAAPRIIGGTPGTSVMGLLRMTLRYADPGDDKHWEHGQFFVGALAIPAVAVGMLRWRALPLVVYAWVFAWLAGGYAEKPSLFAMLREVPVYSTLRYPERFLVLVALAASAIAALGITRAQALARSRWKRARWAKAALALLSLALLADLGPLLTQHFINDEHRTLSPAAEENRDRPFHQARGSRWSLAYYEPMNRGVLSCWDAYPVPQSPLLRGDLAEEQQLDPPGAGTLTPVQWSPNRLELDVSLSRPARLIVNQNWHAGWRTNVGELVDARGLLAVDLPEGSHRVELRFQPRSALGGAAVAAAALLALGELGRRARRARRVRAPREMGDVALAVLAPIAIFGLAAWLLPHRAGPPPELRTLDGQPVVVDSLSESVMRIGARFEGGMTLEAASINNVNPTPGETIVLELDWRRDVKIPAGLGVFVHIEPSKGDGISGDHVLLSSVLDPDDAPPNRILRDVLPISVPQDARGKTWKVWVGLWRVRRGGERIRVVDRGHGVTDGDRILAGTFEPR